VSSQMLNEQTFTQVSIPARRREAAESTMSLPGTIVKAIALLLVALVFGAVGWSVGLDWFSTSSGIWWLIGYFILIGLTIAAASNPDLALPVGLLYAVLMGFWMGAVFRVYEEQYDGIVAHAPGFSQRIPGLSAALHGPGRPRYSQTHTHDHYGDARHIHSVPHRLDPEHFRRRLALLE
jgi:multidrug transporter EmrE-like cation transporter